MTNEENVKLVDAYRAALAAGDRAQAKRALTEIVTKNKGMIIKFAQRWAGKIRFAKEEDKNDAIQAAYMGVLRAVETFDASLGSFSTHLDYHVRDYVQRWSGKNESVTRPRSATMPFAIKRAVMKFRMLNGRDPSAEELGVTQAQLDDWLSATHFVPLDVEPDGDETRAKFELTACADEGEYEARAEQLERAWKDAVADMSPRNRDIAERVLLKGQDTREVGAVHGLTHGRAVQVCKRIETRLRRALNPASYRPDKDIDRKEAARQAGIRARRREFATMAKLPVPYLQKSA